MIASIQSKRLLLTPMGPAILESLLAGDRATAARLLECLVPTDVSVRKSLLARRLRQIRENPSVEPWLLRAIIERSTGTMIGHIGFHAEPGPCAAAGVTVDAAEMGYTIYPLHRRRGYATEAAIAMMRWAYTTHGQRCFILSVSPENLPSMAMTESLGFTRRGSQIDEQDGLEIVFVRQLEEWPGEWMT